MRFCAALTIACAVFGNAVQAQDFNAQINTLIKHNLPGATVGVMLQDAITGQVLYEHQGFKHFFCRRVHLSCLLLLQRYKS